MQTFPAFAMNCQTAFWQDNEECQQDLVLLKNKNKTQPANQTNKKTLEACSQNWRQKKNNISLFPCTRVAFFFKRIYWQFTHILSAFHVLILGPFFYWVVFFFQIYKRSYYMLNCSQHKMLQIVSLCLQLSLVQGFFAPCLSNSCSLAMDRMLTCTMPLAS